MPSVAVIGASADRRKYGNKAVRAYLRQGWTVYPVNSHEPTIEGLPAYRSMRDLPAAPDRVLSLSAARNRHGRPGPTSPPRLRRSSS
jgi:acyl-CoA synthetase (NDP forming)